ncbi:hypothetical protein BC830DRAFT_1150965 [Chytriomyces sp. MP71]|nr:hypothetical protein BC830DRAFT_1150965 [Chytriomyces sp. MP71]
MISLVRRRFQKSRPRILPVLPLRQTSSQSMNLINTDLANLRLSYTSGTLDEGAVAGTTPFTLFDAWLTAAKTTEREANAMTIATADANGRPSARIVLLKAFDERGFVFYTNYNSRKSEQLAQNPYASLTFYWGERQVRIEGSVVKVSDEESDAYFATRPRGSQIGAWVSYDQSSAVASRAVLEEREKQVEEKFEGVEKVDRPPFWGGWRIQPTYVEFWQGREGRLHDRIVFQRSDEPAVAGSVVSSGKDRVRSCEWTTCRLMP